MNRLRVCEGSFDLKGKPVRCRRAAITTRETSRFGRKHEPAIVCYRTHLCLRCSRLFDDAMAAIDAESKVA